VVSAYAHVLDASLQAFLLVSPWDLVDRLAPSRREGSWTPHSRASVAPTPQDRRDEGCGPQVRPQHQTAQVVFGLEHQRAVVVLAAVHQVRPQTEQESFDERDDDYQVFPMSPNVVKGIAWLPGRLALLCETCTGGGLSETWSKLGPKLGGPNKHSTSSCGEYLAIREAKNRTTEVY